MLALSGDAGCAKLDSSAGHDQMSLNACLRKDGDGKSSVDIVLSRSRSDVRTRIEGRVPLANGTRALVGRTEDGDRKLDAYVTAG